MALRVAIYAVLDVLQHYCQPDQVVAAEELAAGGPSVHAAARALGPGPVRAQSGRSLLADFRRGGSDYFVRLGGRQVEHHICRLTVTVRARAVCVGAAVTSTVEEVHLAAIHILAAALNSAVRDAIRAGQAWPIRPCPAVPSGRPTA